MVQSYKSRLMRRIERSNDARPIFTQEDYEDLKIGSPMWKIVGAYIQTAWLRKTFGDKFFKEGTSKSLREAKTQYQGAAESFFKLARDLKKADMDDEADHCKEMGEYCEYMIEVAIPEARKQNNRRPKTGPKWSKTPNGYETEYKDVRIRIERYESEVAQHAGGVRYATGFTKIKGWQYRLAGAPFRGRPHTGSGVYQTLARAKEEAIKEVDRKT